MYGPIKGADYNRRKRTNNEPNKLFKNQNIVNNIR